MLIHSEGIWSPKYAIIIITFDKRPTPSILFQTAGDQEGLNKLLTDMSVEEGKGVMFKDFWNLVDSLANAQFGLLSKEKQVKCVKCSLM